MPTNATTNGCSCRNVRARSTVSAAARRPRLTARQCEIILAWLTFGTKERVAKELFVTPSTVKTHLQRIRKSYTDAGRPAGTKFELFIRAVQDGLVDIEDEATLQQFFAVHDDH